MRPYHILELFYPLLIPWRFRFHLERTLLVYSQQFFFVGILSMVVKPSLYLYKAWLLIVHTRQIKCMEFPKVHQVFLIFEINK